MNRDELALTIAEKILHHLGDAVTAQQATALGKDLLATLDRETLSPKEHWVLTAIGHNRPGIVHEVSGALASHHLDIIDMNQTLVHDNFAMMMVINPDEANVGIAAIKTELRAKLEPAGIKIFLSPEKLLRAIHRVP